MNCRQQIGKLKYEWNEKRPSQLLYTSLLVGMQENKLVCVFEAMINSLKGLEKILFAKYVNNNRETLMSKTITNSRQQKKKNNKNLKTYHYHYLMRTGLSLSYRYVILKYV